MMEIRNALTYKLHNNQQQSNSGSNVAELLLLILLFGSIGAISWAIRGTAGWGGIDGTMVPGLMWGILWYYVAYRKGLDARGIVLWLALGLALGGELGYGQYVSWVRGIFYVGDETMTINPWLGYLWFTISGISWVAPGSIILGWALGKGVSVRMWIFRSLMLASLLVFYFAWPVVDWLGELLVRTNSNMLFPHANLGIYAAELGKHLSRTVYTNTQNLVAVVWWVLVLLISAWRRDKTTVVIGLILGVGFGIGFLQSALWVLGYKLAPNYIDWWKIWELNSGFNFGALYAIAMYWSIRNFNKTYSSEINTDTKESERTKITEWRDTLFLALGGFILLFFVGFEYFFWTGLALSLFYFFAMCLTTTGDLSSNLIAERRKKASLIYSIFFLVFILFHGGSERLGIVFELYDLEGVSQYAWPLNRILLFVPAAIVITAIAMFRMWKVLGPGTDKELGDSRISKQAIRIVDLMTLMGCIGVLSIWPAKISLFYGLFLVLAVYAFNRLERRYNLVDISKN